jgi:Protein of unknown function (DUF4025)
LANIEENTSVGAINKNGGFHLNKKNNNQNSEVAGRMFDPSDYEKKDQLSSGLATTHEQATDTYTEGEIGAVIDDVDGEDIEIGKNRTK